MQPNRALLFYLTWINPVIAVAVLYLCASSLFGGVISSLDPSASTTPSSAADFGDSFSMYFVGKGLFCSSLLFLFGQFFRAYLLRTAPQRTDP